MLINKIVGNFQVDSKKWCNHTIDYLELEWYELPKRILRKQTIAKREIGIQLENTAHSLSDGDILAVVDNVLIVVRVKPDECIAITAGNNYQLAKMCYEIGNRHVPLFIDENDNQRLLLPKDKPLQLLLEKMGFNPIITTARLTRALSAATSSHHHGHEH